MSHPSHGVAIVGAGRMAEAHARGWLALGVRVRAVVSPRRRPSLPAAPDARWDTTLDEALTDPAVTIVSVCTPTPTHAELAIRALEAGRNVLLEKPIALTVEDARAVAAAADRAPGVLMVAQVVRFFPAYAELAERVAAGGIGRVRALRATRLTSSPHRPDWLADEEQSGGMVVDFAIHDFDQANLHFGEPVAVTAVRTPGGYGAPVTTTIEYRDGGVATVLSVADLPEGFAFSTSLDLVGTDGVDALQPAEGEPFVAQARYFLDCVTEGSPPDRCPTSAAVDALRVALAARKSLRASTRVVL
ncbi:Gfo/Idh/MocA family protein [Leifsonia sp. NPDC102414]|uniref:Gfo/Idh/MocA family protein n=1 Tax=Leifsonia sp. NPDC102414 TaxID=3364124 RepID=UPI003811477F